MFSAALRARGEIYSLAFLNAARCNGQRRLLLLWGFLLFYFGRVLRTLPIKCRYILSLFANHAYVLQAGNIFAFLRQ